MNLALGCWLLGWAGEGGSGLWSWLEPHFESGGGLLVSGLGWPGFIHTYIYEYVFDYLLSVPISISISSFILLSISVSMCACLFVGLCGM